jgi:hypothetical protein
MDIRNAGSCPTKRCTPSSDGPRGIVTTVNGVSGKGSTRFLLTGSLGWHQSTATQNLKIYPNSSHSPQELTVSHDPRPVSVFGSMENKCHQ